MRPPQARRHIPDFLLITDTGPTVVDVKPRHRLAHPKVSSTFAWTRTVVAARGWHYEVASKPPVIELANIRFLAGYWRQHPGWRVVGAELSDIAFVEIITVTHGVSFHRHLSYRSEEAAAWRPRGPGR